MLSQGDHWSYAIISHLFILEEAQGLRKKFGKDLVSDAMIALSNMYGTTLGGVLIMRGGILGLIVIKGFHL